MKICMRDLSAGEGPDFAPLHPGDNRVVWNFRRLNAVVTDGQPPAKNPA
jgi:hypothetical protein